MLKVLNNLMLLEKLKILLIYNRDFNSLQSLVSNKIKDANTFFPKNCQHRKLIISLFERAKDSQKISHIFKNDGINNWLLFAVKKGMKNARPMYYRFKNIYKALGTLNLFSFMAVLIPTFQTFSSGVRARALFRCDSLVKSRTPFAFPDRLAR